MTAKMETETTIGYQLQKTGKAGGLLFDRADQSRNHSTTTEPRRWSAVAGWLDADDRPK